MSEDNLSPSLHPSTLAQPLVRRAAALLILAFQRLGSDAGSVVLHAELLRVHRRLFRVLLEAALLATCSELLLLLLTLLVELLLRPILSFTVIIEEVEVLGNTEKLSKYLFVNVKT